MVHDGEIEAVPMLWVCERHRDLVPVAEIEVDEWREPDE
jgi:hypothetical protein